MASSTDALRNLLELMPELDGGLLEIVVPHANASDWKAVIDDFVASGVLISFSVHGVETAPEVTDSVLSNDDSPYVATLRFRSLTWTTSLFNADTIDFQGDPREIRQPEDVAAVADLMAIFARVLEKTVFLYPETTNYRGVTPLFTVEPPN